MLVLLIGALVRLATLVIYQPAVLNLADSLSYLQQASGQLFSDRTHPVGYGAFLRVIHLVFQDVTWTLAAQHLMGLSTAIALYLTARRLGAGRALATIPAAVIALNADLIFLEHALMADALLTVLIALAACAALLALDDLRCFRRRVTSRDAWLLVAGGLLGTAAAVRFVAAPLIPLLAIWAGGSVAAPMRTRMRTGGMALAGGLVILSGYASLNGVLTGNFDLTGPGWGWYVRSAQFANCTKFTPPPGTAQLCERTPPGQRPGPDFYSYELGSPAVRVFGPSPNGAKRVNEFGKQAVLHQPWDYLKTVANDFLRYFADTYDDRRPFSGVGFDLFQFNRRAPGVEELVDRSLNAYYQDEQIHIRGGVTALYDYQQLFRVYGILMAIAIVVALTGLRAATRRERAAVVLAVGGGLMLLLIPVATVIYSQRYALPAEPLFALGATISVVALVRRARLASNSAVSTPTPAAATESEMVKGSVGRVPPLHVVLADRGSRSSVDDSRA